jgi:4-hydroxybenzoyl-CoA thioesterase
MKFSSHWQVRFAHCDPAGIVFYPRYFEMLNNVVEDWCEQGLGMSFHELHLVRGIALPTVHIETDFRRASKLAEQLTAELRVVRIGGASFELVIDVCGPDQQLRLQAKLVLVSMNMQTQKAMPLPDELRSAIKKYMSVESR